LAYEWGDVVWARLPFTDQMGERERPVLIVSTRRRNRGRDVTVAQITSQVAKARTRGDYVLRRWAQANLEKPAALRPKVMVILKGRVTGRIGHLHADDIPGVIGFLREILGCE